MARKPAHIVAQLSVRMPYGQDGVWRVIRELRHGDLKDIYERVSVDRSTAADYLGRLLKGGFIGQLCDAGGWTLLIDQPDTPRLRQDGSPAADTGAGQDHMWRTMKMVDSFSADDLARLASTETVRIKPTAAQSYIKHLTRAGYLTLVEPAKPGSQRTQGRKAVYALRPTMNTGPLAPQIQRTDWVWDPNTRKALAPTTGGRTDAEQ